MAMLTAAGTLVGAPQADALPPMFYWQDSDPGYYRPAPMAQPRKPKVRRPSAKTEATPKETNAKPQGPLIIAVSIEQQKVRVYDANGLFAESPVSTGMKGHSTPMGVFSIIQKHKMHRSNIYSGAPMPYMQRITWSGVAMHAGVLPGYPASHGCIRMPTAFAMKMWNWTRMGARVIITPGQITPASFSHPIAGGAEGRAAAAHRQRSGDRRGCGEERQGRGRRQRDQACEFGGGPRPPIDRRARGAVTRTDPHRGCQQRVAEGRRDHVRRSAVCRLRFSLPAMHRPPK